jgi:hypothetical protein
MAESLSCVVSRCSTVKLYKIILEDKREEFVPADTYQCVDEEYVFFANGQPIPDIFFRASSVIGITVETDNYEQASRI